MSREPKQSFGWVAAQADDVRASYPEAVALIEAEARATAEAEIERLKAGLAKCVGALRSSVGNTDVAIAALGDKVSA